MNQRRRVLLLVLAILALAGVGWWSYFGRGNDPPGVTRANAYRLYRGITREEAGAILGQYRAIGGSGRSYSVLWSEDGLTVDVVYLNSRDGAVSAYLREQLPDGRGRRVTLFERQQPLLDRVRRWFRL